MIPRSRLLCGVVAVKNVKSINHAVAIDESGRIFDPANSAPEPGEFKLKSAWSMARSQPIRASRFVVDVRRKSLAYRYCWRAVSSPRVQNIRNNRLPIPGPAHAPEGSV